MKLSTKGRYATRAMLDLALHYGGGPVLLKDVARRQQISERYLEQLALSLKAAGLVTSMRGARGGFVLARPPSEIRLCDIIEAVEGSLAPVECVDDPGVCPRAGLCAAQEVWAEMKAAISKILGSKTLQDLAMRHREYEEPDTIAYHI